MPTDGNDSHPTELRDKVRALLKEMLWLLNSQMQIARTNKQSSLESQQIAVQVRGYERIARDLGFPPDELFSPAEQRRLWLGVGCGPGETSTELAIWVARIEEQLRPLLASAAGGTPITPEASPQTAPDGEPDAPASPDSTAVGPTTPADVIASASPVVPGEADIESTDPQAAHASPTRESVITELLNSKGLSKGDLAKAAEVDYNTVADWVAGKRKIYASTKKKLAKALEIPVKELP